MYLAIQFFLTITSYQFFKNAQIFINHGLLFRKKYSQLFSILKVKYSVPEILFSKNNYTEKNISQKLPSYLETHHKFRNHVLFSYNSTFIMISIMECARLLIEILL